ncbi:mucin-17-like [Mastacembelus armatus]|uniref:mucin-17-like n=1 Tax=Mastacembelus armatus TaxID=205130 RepID=UPI000E45D601|nr:mucin-17-like [Mastacembelus armatus]
MSTQSSTVQFTHLTNKPTTLLPITQSSNPPIQQPSTGPTKPSTNPPTLEPLKCQNGGTFNGFNCTCPVGLNGMLCQYVELYVEPVTFNRSVLVNVVINEKYNDKYDDTTSSYYKDFVGNFTHQMKTYYLARKIPNLKEVVVIRVSRGDPLIRSSNNIVETIRLWGETMAVYSVPPGPVGVSVTHDVILAIPNNASAGQIYEEDVREIKEAADALLSCTEECPNFNITALPTVNTMEPDLGYQ